MGDIRTEYWIVCFHKRFDSFSIHVKERYYNVALRDENATIEIQSGSKAGKWLIIEKKTFQHLNKVFLIAEVEKVTTA